MIEVIELDAMLLQVKTTVSAMCGHVNSAINIQTHSLTSAFMEETADGKVVMLLELRSLGNERQKRG